MMLLPWITLPSVEIPHFDGTNFILWKTQMSSYLREMNPEVWWMVDICFSHSLEDCLQTQAQEKCLYLKDHVSNALSCALSVEIKDKIEMEYSLLERAGRRLSKYLAQAMTRDHHE
jgi:hypothetical protein